MKRQVFSGAVAGLIGIASLAACGGDDDDSGDDSGTPGASADAGDAADAADAGGAGSVDELALGDPCELVPASAVGEVVGSDVSAELANVGDGLPGATCNYSVAAGGTIALSVTPGGAAMYDGYREQAEAGGIEPVDALGDEGFVFQDVEVVARRGDAMVQLQVFTSATTADTGGVEIVNRALGAIGG